ncbi:hypothetical protein [Hyalangium rubrum]|uniref:Uncharacterized protein n=1 Tax=Hyalangium rubrum TaxID=3103134 RepID=A0ABU5HII3_9BACT|nr:hypothetical protein [Hyalangium sp. s54d21]MDY7233283.1 hypothetical protein [Hyalangium sp. s54d21]
MRVAEAVAPTESVTVSVTWFSLPMVQDPSIRVFEGPVATWVMETYWLPVQE